MPEEAVTEAPKLGRTPIKTAPPSLDFRRVTADVPTLPPRPSAAFSPPPTPTPTPAPPGPAAGTTATAAATPAARPPATRRPRTAGATRGDRRPRKRNQDAAPEPVLPIDGVGIYLPASLRKRLKHFWANQVITDGPRRTYTDIVLDAIEATVDRLREMLKVAAPRSGPLFSGRIPLRETHDEDQVAVTLRPSVEDLAVIDSLVVEFGASSRSTFVAKALGAYLP